ncbi:hypothetical protein LPJ56_003275, partial [Coemansia sp. RSA 2599]
ATSTRTTRAPGWTIRYTGETFDDYEKYLDRLSFYRTPQFTCGSTGQQGLTYEQALLSERASRHITTGIGFSDMLICEMLTFLSQSTLPISMAIDALYYRFQYDFFLGEHIDVKYPGTDGAMYECFVVAMGPLSMGPRVGVFDNDDDDDDEEQSPTAIAIGRLGPRSHEIINYEQRKLRMYTVRLFDMDGNPIDDSDISVRAEELSRSRNVFTKVALRQFLDENMARGPRPGSPWIVRPEWRERFRIPYLYGGEARLLRLPPTVTKSTVQKTAANGSSSQQKPQVPPPKSAIKPVEVDPYADERFVSVKPVRKFPIDDLDLCTMEHVKWNQGVLWTLRNRRRRHQVQQNSASAAAGDKKGKVAGSRQITEFFASKKSAVSEGDAGDKKDGGVENAAGDNDNDDDDDDEAAKHRWPVPLCEWQVPPALVSRMLSTYMFVSCFSSSIKLSPYSLDFFESSLVRGSEHSVAAPGSSSGGIPGASGVYRDTVAALLNVVMGDRRRSGSAKAAAARIEAMVREQDASASDPEDTSLPAVASAVASAPRASRSASGAPRRGRRTAPTQPSALAHSSSAVASEADDSEMDVSDGMSEASTMAPSSGSPKKPGRGKRRANGRRGRVSASRVASESETEPEGPKESQDQAAVAAGAVDVRQLRGHALLRHLSRSWWLGDADADRESWAAVLAGWLLEARSEYPADLRGICESLWNDKDLSVDSLAAAVWNALGDADRRLVVLELLVCECTGVDEIREYLEQTAEAVAELKRERIEVRREMRKIAEQLQELDKAEADEQQRPAVSREQGRREKEAELQRQKERRRLGEAERTQQRRLDNLERDLRRNAVGRLVPLGVDRFLTRYYFLDGVGDCPLAGAGSGRLLVQPAPQPEVEEIMAAQPRFVRAMRALQMSWTWAGGDSPAQHLGPNDEAVPEISAEALAGDEQLAQLAKNGELWGYYATTRQVDALRRWLDPRGRREAALESELELVHLALSASIRKRCHALDASFEARVRIRQSITDRIAAL